MENLVQILKQNSLTGEDVALLQSIAKPQNVKTHKALIDYGERCDRVFFVLKGGFVLKLLNVETGDERAMNFYLASFQPFMTVPQSYFREVPSDCKLQAITNSDVLGFAKKDFIGILQHNERIARFYQARVIEALLGELDFRMKLIAHTPKRLYEILINEAPELVRNVPSKDLANFMGISPEWFSNLKRRI